MEPTHSSAGSRLHIAIRDRYAPSAPQELSPSVGKSTADYGEHAVDDRIRGRQSSRSIHLDEIPQLYGGFRARVLAWVSYAANCNSTRVTANAGPADQSAQVMLFRGSVQGTLSRPLWQKWTTNDGVGNHHRKLLLAFQTFNGLMSHRPNTAAGLCMDNLFLLAVTTGNSHNGVRLFQWGLGHNQPPTDLMLVVGSSHHLDGSPHYDRLLDLQSHPPKRDRSSTCRKTEKSTAPLKARLQFVSLRDDGAQGRKSPCQVTVSRLSSRLMGHLRTRSDLRVVRSCYLSVKK
jgi:hypothetical protein